MAYLLQQLLSRSARTHPDKIAVVARQQTLTYRELEDKSSQLAHLLQQRGLKKGERVGLFFPKCVDSLVSMLGVLKAGGVYVPIDPLMPADRAGYILSNCGVRVLITSREKRMALSAETLGQMDVCLLVDGTEADAAAGMVSWAALGEQPTVAPKVTLTETDLAYILYTSGSTGRPKGVMLSHQNALTFVEWCREEFQVRSEDRLSNHAPLHFDLSVFDVYNTLEAGATLYMVTEDIALFPTTQAKFIEDNQITIWYSVPSALTLMVLHARLTVEKLRSLRILLFAGEVFPMKYLRQLAALAPDVELYNLYGPTETNVCTYYKVERERMESLDNLPIGAACANTECFVVSEDGKLLGEGQQGELYVRGPSVTYGYWADPEKTRKMCVPNVFQEHFEEKAYRTGDLVTLAPDGYYYFAGRRDNQIKSRGYRIELGEIETALLSHEGVQEAAVVAIPDEVIGNRLKAFVSLHQPGSLKMVDLQQYCSTLVPKYMIPESIEFYEVLPKTSTGKLDRVKMAQGTKAVPQSAS